MNIEVKGHVFWWFVSHAQKKPKFRTEIREKNKRLILSYTEEAKKSLTSK